MAKFPLGTRRSGIRLGTTRRWAFWFTLTQPVRSVRVRRFQTPRRICGVLGRVRTGFPGARTGEPTWTTYLSGTGVCSRKTRVGRRRVRVGRWSCRVSIRILPLRGFENGASGRVRIVPPKYMSGAGVCSRKKSGSRRYGPSGRIRIFPQVSIGGRCEFTEQEVVGGRCVTNGKEKTQPRTDDLSS